MKIAYISDLYNDFLRDIGLPIPDIELDEAADVLVLAGNIDVQEHGAIYAVKQSQRLGIPVLYVLGNHEFYEAQEEPVRDRIKTITRGTDVHVLDAESIIIDGVMFIGATLWSDFMLCGEDKHKRVVSFASGINDYRDIWLPDDTSPFFLRALTVDDTLQWHKFERQFIENSLADHRDCTKVVITHHVPSEECLPEHQRSNSISASYTSRLDGLIENHQPSAWIYGHIDGESRFTIGDTIVCRNVVEHPGLTPTIEKAYVPKIVEIDSSRRVNDMATEHRIEMGYEDGR